MKASVLSLLLSLLCTVLVLEGSYGILADPAAPTLGVCYYPEQWDSALWQSDLQAMKDAGIKYVRMAEFSWSIIEPSATSGYQWELFDNVLNKMNQLGLKAIMGTPTATPPKWLIDLYPDILPVDDQGRIRHFGSRRQYSFSSPEYFNQTEKIVTAMAQHYGNHPAVVGWQMDNEYGCHDTVRSYDKNAAKNFRKWLSSRYNSNITQLNEAWGNVFWSMVYDTFDAIDLPFLTVTEANPSARLDFYRFASDEVVRYNKMQVDTVRKYSPGRFITTNFMGFFFQFDAFKLGENLDFAAWDSYPLGFLDTGGPLFTETEKIRYAQSGHPDIASFHHDLYRAVGNGRFWVMEQQPGPVNWADNNPSPAPGVIRLWTWEAIAHGAEVVSYFRWREAPFAQEQYHAGLNRRDNVPDIGLSEAKQVVSELSGFPTDWYKTPSGVPKVALVVDFEAEWILGIEPQGVNFLYAPLVYNFYSSLRRLGLHVDIIKQGSDLSSYALVVIPTLPYMREEMVNSLTAYTGPVILGPRVGSKTVSFQIPASLPPGVETLVPIKIARVESFRQGFSKPVSWNGKKYNAIYWKEWIEIDAQSSAATVSTTATYDDVIYPQYQSAVVVAASTNNSRKVHYLSFWPEKAFIRDYLMHVCRSNNIPYINNLRDDLRISRKGDYTFVFSYSPKEIRLDSSCNSDGADFMVGGRKIAPYGVAAWRTGNGEQCIGGDTINDGGDTTGSVPTMGIVVVALAASGTLFSAFIFVGLRFRHLWCRRGYETATSSILPSERF